MWAKLILIMGVVAANHIRHNKSLSKIVLSQKGLTQFLQYDLDISPLIEFTFCTWIRFYDVNGKHTIFQYVTSQNQPLIKLWLDSDGKHLIFAVNKWKSSPANVQFAENEWRHVCISYQSHYGAWAIYVDAELVTCESSRLVTDYIIPGGGSIIIGVGSPENVLNTGFEGEIFGTNMLLVSTIEKNSKKMSVSRNISKKYIKSFDKLKNDPDQNFAIFVNGKISNSTFHAPFRMGSNQDIASNSTLRYNIYKQVKTPAAIEIERKLINMKAFRDSSADFRKYRYFRHNINGEQSSSNTQYLPMISEYEQPPPENQSHIDYLERQLEIQQPPDINLNYDLSKNSEILPPLPASVAKVERETLNNVIAPPPLDEKMQISKAKFSIMVLNYLKGKNYRMMKIPQTIPLMEISDSHPYASKSRYNVAKLPKLVEKRNDILTFSTQIFSTKVEPTMKTNFQTNTAARQINVQILENNIRDEISKLHALINPKNVEIINRGNFEKYKRFYRNVNSQQSPKVVDDRVPTKPTRISLRNENNVERKQNIPTRFKLPIKSKDYLNDYLEGVAKHEDDDNNDSSNINFDDVQNINIHSDFITMSPNHKFLTYNVKKRIMMMNTHLKNSLIFPHKRIEKHPAERFDHKIKIGNALNERYLIGDDEKETKQSFEGGYQNIPSIQKYRSYKDNGHDEVPASLGPRVCKTDNLSSILYVLSDGSIANTNKLNSDIISDFAIKFIVHNYKTCSLDRFESRNDAEIIINWNKTPVKLVGGAYPKPDTDLCVPISQINLNK